MDNEKNLEKALDELKDFNPSDEDLDKFKQMADEYKDKSEEEVFVEIIKLNKKIESDMGKEEHEELLHKLETIKPLLNEEQIEKLEEILIILREE